jgi:hypothetical protein
MKAWVPADPVESITPKPGTRRGVPEILRWFAQIGATIKTVTKHFLRPRHPGYPFTAEQRAESTLEEAGAATENVVANLTTTAEPFTAPVTAGVNVDTDALSDSAAATVLDHEEIQRRRDLVRMLFNDFWSGAYEKPATVRGAARPGRRSCERAISGDWRILAARRQDTDNARLAASGEFTQ